MLEIILLSIIQGITEFLPISSSAHLILFSKLLSYNNQNLVLDVSLHFGSLLAVIIYFKNEILNFFKNKSLFLLILISSVPTIIFGYLLVKLNLIDYFRNIYFIGLTSIIFGVLLYLSDQTVTKKNIADDLTLKYGIYIGLFQILSLIPGVSRSGITITSARFLKFNRVDSAKISFLFAIPTLLAVSFYNVLKIIQLNDLHIAIENFWAMFLAFLVSLITLKFFIKFLKKFTLITFVIYRLILGIIIFIYVFNS
jgi:undecaprenyl-diphosphatase